MKQVTANTITRLIRSQANTERARVNAWFFKTGRGEYGEGDRFLGVTMPQIRAVVRNAGEIAIPHIERLMASPWHEIRMCGVLLLVKRYEKSDADGKMAAYQCYLSHIAQHINNWDLVDVSAPHVVGAYLLNESKKPLLVLAKSKNMWERRVAIVATARCIAYGDYDTTCCIADLLMADTQDLIHKATGWMLREVGKKGGLPVLRAYLESRAATMPRTMLRYAIEKMGEAERKKWLGKR